MRPFRLFLLLFLPLTLVAACAGSSGGAKPSPSSTSSLAAVTVTGAAGATPTVKLAKTPFTVVNTVTKTLTKGTGPLVIKGQKIQVNYLLVDGRDGTEKDTTFGKTPQVFTADPAQVLPGIADGLLNQTIGSRVLVAIPPKDAFGTTGNTNLGVQKDDTLVFVMDLKSATTPLTKPAGATVTPKAGLPKVTQDAKGVPSVTLPKGAAPTKLVVQPLIKGTGPAVKSGQDLVVNYVGVIWPGGKVFDSSYAKGQTSELSIGVGQVIKGWDQGLIGQTVGSRVMLVIPPDLGYGAAGNTSGGIKGSDTLVFVIDVLAAI